MSTTNVTWHEWQEVNEADPTDLAKGIMNDRVSQIKRKYELTNEQLVELHNENRSILPDPKDWL